MHGLLVATIVAFPAVINPPSEAAIVAEIAAHHLEGAIVEHRLFDGTRCDLLWDGRAIEVDWGHKWAEGVGQAIYYGRILDRDPVLILIEPDNRYVYRALLCGVEVWIFRDGELIRP